MIASNAMMVMTKIYQMNPHKWPESVTNDKTVKMLAWNAMWKFSDVAEIYQRSN